VGGPYQLPDEAVLRWGEGSRRFATCSRTAGVTKQPGTY
jgi:hypothetical protein